MMKTNFWVKFEFVCFTMSVIQKEKRPHNFWTKIGNSKHSGWGETTCLVAF